MACVGKQRAIEVALCHGWIDGQLNPYDERFWLVRFTPRKAKSRWSEVNRATAQRLIDAGHMHPAGLQQVDAAQRDGRWDGAYAPQSQATVPPDLQAALAACPAALAFFAQLTGANRCTSTRSRSVPESGRLAMVSTKPASTVSGVRISCDTLATKSRRMASVRSRSVTSCETISFRPSP